MEPKTESEKAYRYIRNDIINGRLSPGEKLKMTMLKEMYKIGAAPLREALSRLASDRLAIQSGQKGFVVSSISATDAIDTGRVRLLLESEALRDSLKHASDEWESRVVAAYHRLNLAEKRADGLTETILELENWNRKFHEALISNAQSTWLLEFRNQIYCHHERYRQLSRRSRTKSRDTTKEHHMMLEAAMSRDLKTLLELTALHIDRTTEAAVAFLNSSVDQ